MDRRSLLKILGIIPIGSKFIFSNFCHETCDSAPVNLTGLKSSMKMPNGFCSLWNDLKEGEHLAISGIPSIGKTSVAINILNELCINQRQKCVFFAIEEDSKKIINRLMAVRSEISLSDITSGKLDDYQLDRIVEESKVIANSNLYIDDAGNMKCEDLLRKIKSFKKTNHDLKYVFIDYLQLVGKKKLNYSTVDLMNHFLYELKKVAQSEKIVLITLSQLNRGGDETPLIPKKEQMREITDYELIDKVTLLYRENLSDNQALAIRPSRERINFINFTNQNNSFEHKFAIIDRQSLRIYD